MSTQENTIETVQEEGVETHTSEGTSENAVAAVAGQFGLDGPKFAMQSVNFLIALTVLWIFVYKPIVKLLDERTEKIAKSVKQAESIEKRVSAIEEERETIIVEARKEAQTIAEKAKVDSEVRGNEMIESAKREVERVIVKGKKQLQDEKTIMIKELKKDIVDMSMKAAARIVVDQIDEKKSKSLAEEIVRKMS